MAKQKGTTQHSTPRAVENGQPSEEYKRFESLMKRLVSVPKKAIDSAREAERKR